MTFDISVIVSTYNSPACLQKTLWGFQAQSHSDFEIIVADDGSTRETAKMLEQFKRDGMNLVHLWQEDDGFRKNRILNKAILTACSQYCIFTDGDCIPRSDFVETHCRLRKRKHFLTAGSHVNLPDGFHQNISRDEIQTGDAFRPDWLKAHGYDSSKGLFRLSASQWTLPLLNRVTHRRGIFTGNGSSVWRDDALAVNGFDERLRYGHDDTDFGARLTAAGIRSRMRKFSLINLHQDHPKPYMDRAVVAANKLHLQKVRAEKISWTEFGISSHSASDAAEETIRRMAG